MGNFFSERGNAFFRLLDRYIGIPLVFILSFFRKKRRLPDSNITIRNIAFIKMSGIGDSILTIPLIKKIKQSSPDAGITVICGTNNRIVYQNLLDKNYIDELICLEYGRFILEWRYLWHQIRAIRSLRYDFSIDLDPWSRLSALISIMLRSDYKLGFRKENQYKHFPYDHYQVHRQSEHEFDTYRQLTEPVIGAVEQYPVYPVSDEDSVFFKNFAGKHDIRQYVVLHPWAAGYKNTRKELDMASLTYIGNKLAERGYTIMITGGPGDTEGSHLLAERIHNSFSIAGKTSLNETAVFLKNAQCVVTVNTGILHLAAASGSKIVSVNGPTDINRWGPLSNKAINVKSSLFCSPCLDLGFEYKCSQHGVPNGHCMKKIDLDEVVNAAEELIAAS